MNSSLETLFLPLQNGDVPVVTPALFLGASQHPILRDMDCDFWQPWNPLSLGLAIVEKIPDQKYSLALVHLPKQVEEAKYWLAMALEALIPEGILLAAAANDAGGSRLEKWFVEAGLEPSSLSKNKARAVWAFRPRSLVPLIDDWKQSGLPRFVDLGDDLKFLSQPGVFSWDRIDAGSKLLAEHFTASLRGTGADFGAGIGYLSHRLLSSNMPPKNLYVLDADSRALNCAKTNLEPVRGDCNLMFGWEDLNKPVSNVQPLDFIVMNPPFHIGKMTNNSLGRNFIETASHHLKKGGTLLMVANTHLRYEDILKINFTNVRQVAQKDGFKILEARK